MTVLKIDDSIAEAHASLGYTALFYEWKWSTADREFRRAIEINPNYASAHQWYAWYYFVMNRLEDAVSAMRRAHQLDPLSPIINCHLAVSLSYVEKHDEAAEIVRQMLELNPQFALGYMALGAIHWRAGWKDASIDEFRKAVELSNGRFGLGWNGYAAATLGLQDEATEILKRLEEQLAAGPASLLEAALICAGMKLPDETFAWLDRAYENRTSDLIRLRLHPWPPAIRSDRRFETLAHKIGVG